MDPRAAAVVDLADARWFPVDLDVRRSCVHLAELDEATIEQAAFVDNRLSIEPGAVRVVPLDAVAATAPTPQAPAWLWHTSFCGSTLLARALHLSPHTVSLREPLPLRRLSDLRDGGGDIAPFVGPVVGLLARPWGAGGRVVVKPTHAALNIAGPLMAAIPASRGVVLTSSLDDFVVSHLKKAPETLGRIATLAERALRAGSLVARLPPEAFSPPDALCAAALQWAAQRDLVAGLVAVCGEDRIRTMHWDTAQHDLVAAAGEAARWLQLGLPEKALACHVAKLGARHAKSPTRPYDARTRDAEAKLLRSRYVREVAGALRWAERWLLPNMSRAAIEG